MTKEEIVEKVTEIIIEDIIRKVKSKMFQGGTNLIVEGSLDSKYN